RGDSGSHSFRTCAGKAGAHKDGWKIYVRGRRDRQETKCYNAGKKNGNGDQRRGDGPSNEGRGKVRGKVHPLVSVGRLLDGIANVKGEAAPKPIEREINNRGGVKRQQLAEYEAADDGDAERTAQFRAHTRAEREWQTAEQCGHGGHHDRPETKQASFVDGVERGLPFLALGFEGEVDHHDGVLLD